ncbi:MAG TPA: Spy/CpxP family protein refolding chaperone [Pyrinomonadaceae bacterium]|nr:Spy/CpxP family protein refolding chaperone [Pyrinomonadaceae bacterium]
MRTLTHNTRVAVMYGYAIALLLLCAPQSPAQNAARQQQPSEETPAAAAADAASLLSQLNLTAAQVAQMREIREQSVPQARELTRRLNQARRALDESIYSDSPDEALVQQRAREVSEAQAALVRLRAQTELRVRRVLTPEQLQTFRDLRIGARRRQRIQRRLERGIDERPLRRRLERRRALGRP